MKTNFILNKFCNKCLFIFKNCQLINGKNDLDVNEIFKIDTNLVNEETLKNNCKFCFGILKENNVEKIIEQIKGKINDYEYIDYKITTNFSALFSIIHAYVILNLKKYIL
jgi:tRNA U54 and U55 pseudouridine synthase Pus10